MAGEQFLVPLFSEGLRLTGYCMLTGFIAKKLCPELIFVQNRFWRYSEMSGKIMDIFHRYDPDMCPAGCDEGYLKYVTFTQKY
jgi:DNA polymerase kappa